jgi:hypothetical protein
MMMVLSVVLLRTTMLLTPRLVCPPAPSRYQSALRRIRIVQKLIRMHLLRKKFLR